MQIKKKYTERKKRRNFNQLYVTRIFDEREKKPNFTCYKLETKLPNEKEMK